MIFFLLMCAVQKILWKDRERNHSIVKFLNIYNTN
jgi:hypothetical protein